MSIISYNAAISTCEKGGKSSGALALLNTGGISGFTW